jgi:integrase
LYAAEDIEDETMDIPFIKPASVSTAPLSREQALTLLQATEKRRALHAMLACALQLGITQNEVLGITANDLNHERGSIILYQPRRELVVPDMAMRSLSDVRSALTNGTQKLFDFSDRTVDKAVSDLGIGTLGFPISWSTLRKTWAVMCFQRGVRIESMVRYSGSSVEALSKWAVYGRRGIDLPIDLLG